MAIKPIKTIKRSIWRKVFTILVILLFLGVVLAIVLVNTRYIDILSKTPFLSKTP